MSAHAQTRLSPAALNLIAAVARGWAALIWFKAVDVSAVHPEWMKFVFGGATPDALLLSGIPTRVSH